MGIITILWEKWVEFRRDFYKITLAAMIAPLMYLIVFGMYSVFTRKPLTRL